MELFAIGIVSAGCAANQIAAHFLLYRYELPLTARYAVGSVLLGVWFTFGALWLNTALTPLLSIVLFWATLLPGGALVIVAYWVRAVMQQHDSAAFEAGRDAAQEPLAGSSLLILEGRDTNGTAYNRRGSPISERS